MTRVLFYVQHLLGIGHLARASRVARACQAQGMQVTLVTGGLPVPGFPGDDLDHHALPPIASGDAGFSGLVTGTGAPADAAYLDARTADLLALFHRLKPDVVVTEAFPFGRRQVRFELLPLLAAIAASNPRPRLAASVRDILQRRTNPKRDEETRDLVLAHYDRVLVHGDPAFARLDDSFPFAAAIADKVAYTGLVCPPPPPPATEGFDVVASAGGGAVGGALIRAVAAAVPLLPDLKRWCLIAGPNLPQPEFDALAAALPQGAVLERFRRDFASLLSGARLSVSQAGYNTVGDILQAGCRSLLIPFALGGETEQTDRATRLQAIGRAAVLTEDALDGPAMAQAIRAALDAPLPPVTLATDGAETSARLIAELARRG